MSVVEPVDWGVGAVSVLDEYLVLGTVPEVEGLGDDGVVLGLDEVFDEVVDERSLARAEVLAFGGLTGSAGGCTGSGAGGRVMALVGTLGAGGCWGCSQYPSVVSTVYQLNLNSGTLSDSPVSSR
jgi:hypothetical protein